MPDENEVVAQELQTVTPEVQPNMEEVKAIIEEAKVKEAPKHFESIQELFQKTMQVQSKALMRGQLVGVNSGTKYHMSKEKAKQKRKVARASRKKNRN